MDECKPLPHGGLADESQRAHLNHVDAGQQGLTLVHFSAQLEPCLTLKNTLHTLKTP